MQILNLIHKKVSLLFVLMMVRDRDQVDPIKGTISPKQRQPPKSLKTRMVMWLNNQ